MMKHLTNKLINAGIEESEAKKEISILEKEIKDLNKIEDIVNERIKTRKPLQYILGKAYFMGFEVVVNENVLIPRPETELLVEETARRFESQLKPTGQITILDIGTGSGVIPIALAKEFPESKITSIDIDKKIVELAQRNAIKNNVNERINFKICDVFSSCFEGLINTHDFDLIISNPPYVKDEDLKSLSPEVQHEPKEALSGNIENKSGIEYYKRIIECFIDKKPSLIAFEIDPLLVQDLELLMTKHHIKKYEIIKDYSEQERFLFISQV